MMAMMIAALLIFVLTACGGSTDTDSSTDSSTSSEAENRQGDADDDAAATEDTAAAEDSAAAEEESSSEDAAGGQEEASQEGSGVLVVYFSATGTTKSVAEKIASIENADLYEIKAAQEYTEEDLNWNDSDSRTTHEQNDPSVRPEIGSEEVSLDGYSKIYIGYPIWWGEEPRIMDTFVESHDFTDITMIPFCTSSSSGIGRSGQNLADNAGSGNWLDGQRFGAGASEAEVQSWIEGIQ